MSRTIKIKRGKDIQLVGSPANEVLSLDSPATYAIKPTDFKGLVPKMVVKQGDEVKAGDCLFADKSNPAVCFTSPVSGEVAEVVRGERRAIQEIRILADKENRHKEFNTAGFESMSTEEIKKPHTGKWVVANASTTSLWCYCRD